MDAPARRANNGLLGGRRGGLGVVAVAHNDELVQVVAAKVRVPRVPSMPLERLDARLDHVWSHGLGLIVAPAGSGKTTLLARFAARSRGPVAWYRAEAWDRDEAALLRHVEASLAPALNGIARGWRSVADAANALADWQGQPLLLVIDDLHTLEGTPAEAALERLFDYAHPPLTVVAASRVVPRFNLPRLRVSGSVLELTGEDLRFRSWEVERLFRDFYDEPLPPEELARLAQRTGGWAAGLQLFHLATRGRPADERRRLLNELGASSRLTRDYLTRNVLEQLPADLRRFLVDTSVLGRLTPALCDRLLSSHDSARLLAELERRRLFLQPLAEDGAYRYHEVLRAHLQGVLLEELGEDGLRGRFRVAARLLAESEALPEALQAYCRGDDWQSARRLLGRQGEAVADLSRASLDGIPAALLTHDPWLLLASARRLRAEGRLQSAVERYQRAEAAFGSSDTALVCRDERQAVAAFLDGASSRRRDPLALLRAALVRDPASVAREASAMPGPAGAIVAGLGALLDGDVVRARRQLLAAPDDPAAGRDAQIVAGLAAGVSGLLMGESRAALEVEVSVAAAEAGGSEWLARVGRAALAIGGTPDALAEAASVAAAGSSIGDRWGAALARLFAAWGAVTAGQLLPAADELVYELRALDAAVLESWAQGLAAVAAADAGEPEAAATGLAAESLARSTGGNAGRLLAYLALAGTVDDAGEADEYRSLAAAIVGETGLRLARPRGELDAAPMAGSTSVPGGEVGAPPMEIRLLGGFELRLNGSPIDLAAVRPRARMLLRLLCLNADSAVHHETIEAALWPDADRAASTRNLHVAIAALRRALEPGGSRGSFTILRRQGDAYRLALPAGSRVDIHEFDRAVAAARRARPHDGESATPIYEAALELYGGDILPEDGPAEWLAERREAYRLKAADVAHALAELLLERGDLAAAARACSAGLELDRYHDPLWRLLISARDAAGDQGAANRARLGYERMLGELGVDTVSGVP
ncbi:hypothetical protein BH23CHL7_BH23CHL7_23580 [soil metagenome]